MNSQVTLVCPQLGTIYQTIDATNPPSLSTLGQIVGGVFGNTGSQWYIQNSDGSTTPVNSNTPAAVGSTYSASANVKAGI